MDRDLPELSKDIYLKIAADTDDDRTILNMLSVNKKYNNEELFRYIMYRRYPLLAEKKVRQQEQIRQHYPMIEKPGETWKQLYVRTIHALAYLKEKYDIPYVPHPDFNPFTFGLGSNNKFYLTTIALNLAAEIGNKQLVEFFAQRLRNMEHVLGQWREEGLLYAARGGHIDLVTYFMNLGATDTEFALITAAKGGHLDLLKYLIKYLDERGTPPGLDQAMLAAVETGRKDIVEFLISKGVRNNATGLLYAVMRGHKELVEFFVEQGVTDAAFERALNTAESISARTGKVDILNYLVAFSATR